VTLSTLWWSYVNPTRNETDTHANFLSTSSGSRLTPFCSSGLNASYEIPESSGGSSQGTVGVPRGETEDLSHVVSTDLHSIVHAVLTKCLNPPLNSRFSRLLFVCHFWIHRRHSRRPSLRTVPCCEQLCSCPLTIPTKAMIALLIALRSPAQPIEALRLRRLPWARSEGDRRA
jgi:hypothetical protein